jgi:hypothetical protein
MTFLLILSAALFGICLIQYSKIIDTQELSVQRLTDAEFWKESGSKQHLIMKQLYYNIEELNKSLVESNKMNYELTQKIDFLDLQVKVANGNEEIYERRIKRLERKIKQPKKKGKK